MNFIENHISDKGKEILQNKYEDTEEITNNIPKEEIDKTIAELEKHNKRLERFQRIIHAIQSEIEIDPGRLMGLTDGIFGIVMTLLIFGMVLPNKEIVNYTGFLNFISSIMPTIGLTLVSFVLLATFWIFHHEFIKLKNVNMIYLWITMLYLVSLTFIPFSTSLMGVYSQFFLSDVIFGFNILIASLSFLLMFFYASLRGLLDEEAIGCDNRYILNTILIIMGFTILVSALDFFVNPNLFYLFLLVPVITTIRDIQYKLKREDES